MGSRHPARPWSNRRIDLRITAATMAPRFMVRAALVVVIWLAVSYPVADVRVLLLRIGG